MAGRDVLRGVCMCHAASHLARRESDIVSLTRCTRRRTPFTPFAIRNETGLSVWFRRLSAKGKVGPSCSSTSGVDPWVQVEDGHEVEFSFEEGGRGGNLGGSGSAHQIILSVEGWQEVSPVTIDRVGTFSRMAYLAISFLEMRN